jgi:hypothetical protein
VARTIHWTVVPSTDPCPTPAYAEIIPPDETDPLVVALAVRGGLRRPHRRLSVRRDSLTR